MRQYRAETGHRLGKAGPTACFRHNQNMRLSPLQIQAIKQVSANVFGPGARTYLFGSRVDDQQRGGDIDLYITDIECPPGSHTDAKLRFLVKIKQRLGDQRIDVVLAPAAGETVWPIHRMAQETGVLL